MLKKIIKCWSYITLYNFITNLLLITNESQAELSQGSNGIQMF